MGNCSHTVFWVLDGRSAQEQQETHTVTELINLAMAYNNFFSVVLLFLCNLSVVLTESSTVSCYRIEPGTIAGIICADVLLTLIIVIVTYRCASFRRQKIENANKVYMNVRANCKT